MKQNSIIMNNYEDELESQVEEFKQANLDNVKNGNSNAFGAGIGAVAGYVALAGGEASIATYVGSTLLAATGVAIAAPVIALGIGYLAYKAYGGFARKAIREIDDQVKRGEGQ